MIEKQEISSLMKAVAGVVREYVDGKADPLGTRLSGLESRVEEVSKPDRFKSYLDASVDVVRKDASGLDDKLGGIEKRLDATNTAIAEAVAPFAVRLTGIEAKVEEAANTERFRPFLETALDAVRKESGKVDEKLGEIEKRLETTADKFYDAVGPLELQVHEWNRRIEDLSKTIPPDPAEKIQKLVDNVGATVVRLDGCEKQMESLSALAAGIDPLDRKLAGLTERVEKVALSIPADTTESVSAARAEISAVGKRIDGIEPRLEGLAKSAAEVTPITERIIRLETRYEDVKREAIDAGIAKAIEDFAGKAVSPLNDKIGTLEARLADVGKSAAEAVNPLTTKIDDLSSRFKEIDAANDARHEKILKSVDVQIVEAVNRLPPPKDGEHGKDGVSAYQIAVSKGFFGSEDEWLSSLNGCDGIAGESITGPKGEAGKDAEPVDIALVVKEVVAQIPVPKDGVDGKDGKDAEPVSDELVRAEVAKAVAEIPKPKDVSPDVVAELVVAEVQKAVSELPKAKDGKDGLAGKDAEPVDVEKIIAGVVARIPVPRDGERGPPGESIVGLKGEPGRDVPIEVVSALVAGEVAKAIGALPKAEKARDGEDGRDALHIEVLPMIDTSKSAPRGTFASHNGGLWRAARNTDAGEDLHLCGWQSVVEGFPEIDVEQGDDLRTFTLRAVSSTGRKMEKSFSLPVMIDRGVFKADTAYVAGDVVSYGGSIWIAQHETKDSPGSSDAFRLAVKRGRDAKDVALLSPKTPQQVRLK